VQRHLKRCRGCRRRQQRLLRLDQALAAMPLPPSRPQALSRLRQKLFDLAAVPESGGPPRVLPPGRWQRWLFPFATAAALLVGMGCGWLLWKQSPAEDEARPGLQVRHAQPPRLVAGEVVFRTLGHDLRLAETAVPQEQLQALADMAADLRKEATRMIQEGPLEDLPLVSDLYQRVLRQGLIGRAQRLPAPQQELLLPTLAEQLHADRLDLEQAGERTLPAAGDYLWQMEEATEHTARFLRPRAPLGQTAPAPDVGKEAARTSSLLAVLVLGGLRLAEEPHPLPRADCCTDIADKLAEVIALLAAQGHTEEASRLGQLLGDFLERGVANSLTRADAEGLDEIHWTQLQRVGRRARRAGDMLQRNLEHAPWPARNGLLRALEASRHGRQQAELAGKRVGRGKGKWPGSPHKGKGGAARTALPAPRPAQGRHSLIPGAVPA
jgi:hypothetical protein